MSTPKFLRNRKTGAVFPFNAHLAKRNRHMEPYNGADEPVFEEVNAEIKVTAKGKQEPVGGELDAPDEQLMIGDIVLADATKQQMIDFAKNAFGAELNSRDTAESLRDQLTVLMSAE